jgi:hypothetical protein
MFSFIYRLYFFKFRSGFIDNYYNRIIIFISNLVLPLVFRLDRRKKYSLNPAPANQDIQYIVSLTTFPARIRKVWLTIESILRQSEKPDKILLWLYEGEFNGKQSLPANLLELEKRGLDIRFCDANLMPHKKYFYTMQEYPDAYVITIDDDFFFSPNLLSKLKDFHSRYPESIICPIAKKISICNKTVEPYYKWVYCNSNSEPTNNNLTMGGGGTFFPPKALHEEVFSIELLIQYALVADDLWLKIMSVKNGTKVVSIAGEFPRFFIPIKNIRDEKLMDTNILEGNNDKVIASLLEHYQIPIEVLKE